MEERELETERSRQEFEENWLEASIATANSQERNSVDTVCIPIFPKLPVFNEHLDIIGAYLLWCEGLATNANWKKNA